MICLCFVLQSFMYLLALDKQYLQEGLFNRETIWSD